MAKHLFISLLIIFCSFNYTINAQVKQISKHKPAFTNQSKQVSVPSSVNNVMSPSQVTANIVTYGYLASTTQTLDLTLSFSNADQEYADSIAITFPAGITPIGTPNLTFPTVDSDGGYANYNGIIGQTITWGENNNDKYGGVFGYALHFKVAINVGALTGIQTATFHLSGDGYAQFSPSVDYDGTFQISPKIPVDLRIIDFFIPENSCLNGTSDIIGLYLRNDGYNTTSGPINLSYQIAGNTAVNETSTVTLAPNDTLKYIFTTTANFSALGGYTVTGSVTNSLDGNTANNTNQQTTHTYPKTNLPYLTGFEDSPTTDLLNWYGEDNDSPSSWDTTYLSPKSGTYCMRMLEVNAATCDDWLFSPCLNMQSNSNYYLKYWTRLSSGYKASMAIFLTVGQNSDAITQTLKTGAALVDNNTWIKDSIPFTVPSDGVYHIAFEAFNNTEEIIALRLDEVTVADVNSVIGINEVLQDEVSVYPNPTSGLIHVYSPNSNMNIEFFNTLGQKVYSGKTTMYGENIIDLSFLANGHYVAKFSNDRNVFHKNIILENN